MKKNIFISALLLGASALATTGCSSSFLEEENELRVSESQVYTDATRVYQTLTGVYDALKYGYAMGGRCYVAMDVRGDDFINNTENLTELADTYNMKCNSASAECYYLWYYSYLSINRANVFLNGVATYDSKSVLGDALCNQYIAEAKFVRALNYYYLSQMFSKPYVLDPSAKSVMLRTEPITSAGSNDCARSTISEVYAQILSDLSNENIAALSSDINTATATTHASKGAAYMLKMRVYMAMENWSEAIKCGEAIQKLGYMLDGEFGAQFSSPYFTKETIFSFPNGSLDIPGTQSNPYYYYSTDMILDMTSGVASKNGYFLASDARISNYVTINSDGDYMIKKYQDANQWDWLPIFRYAETLLNLAECYAETNQTSSAVQCLSAVRSRSIKKGDVLNVSTMSGSTLTTAIENEKRLEFLGEGMRGLEISRKGQNYSKQGGLINVSSSDNNYYVWPIPETERINNSLWNK